LSYNSADGNCDDGGLGSEYSICSPHTDCTDCGVRQPPCGSTAAGESFGALDSVDANTGAPLLLLSFYSDDRDAAHALRNKISVYVFLGFMAYAGAICVAVNGCSFPRQLLTYTIFIFMVTVALAALAVAVGLGLTALGLPLSLTVGLSACSPLIFYVLQLLICPRWGATSFECVDSTILGFGRILFFPCRLCSRNKDSVYMA